MEVIRLRFKQASGAYMVIGLERSPVGSVRTGMPVIAWLLQSWFPATVSDDFAMMLRYSVSVYRLLFYLNADIRRANDENWRMEYGVSAMSLVRSLIDCLYNVTAILQNPQQKGADYRRSGLHKMLIDLDEDAREYGGDAKWDAYLAERRKAVELLVRMSGFSLDQVMRAPQWPTFGKYINDRQAGGADRFHRSFSLGEKPQGQA